MSKNDVRCTYKRLLTEDQATFRRWLHTNAVIASLFILMFAALVLAGGAGKETRAVSPPVAAMIDDISAVSKPTLQDKAAFHPKDMKTAY